MLCIITAAAVDASTTTHSSSDHCRRPRRVIVFRTIACDDDRAAVHTIVAND